MNTDLPDDAAPWMDPDDAPELTEEFFINATPSIGDRVVTQQEYAGQFQRRITESRKRMGLPPLHIESAWVGPDDAPELTET